MASGLNLASWYRHAQLPHTRTAMCSTLGGNTLEQSTSSSTKYNVMNCNCKRQSYKYKIHQISKLLQQEYISTVVSTFESTTTTFPHSIKLLKCISDLNLNYSKTLLFSNPNRILNHNFINFTSSYKTMVEVLPFICCQGWPHCCEVVIVLKRKRNLSSG